jgi:hypothetical protein
MMNSHPPAFITSSPSRDIFASPPSLLLQHCLLVKVFTAENTDCHTAMKSNLANDDTDEQRKRQAQGSL